MPGSDQDVIKVRYDFKHPVELSSFTASLEGLADLHRVRTTADEDAPKELRLFIREVREGSIEVDLVEMLRVAGGALAPVATHAHVAIETIHRAKAIFDWLKGGKHKPEDTTKKEIEAASKFLAPVADNSGSNVQINLSDSPGAVIMIGSIDANAMQNGATKALAVMKEPVKETLWEVPLVWHQTDRNGASEGRTGLKAIVEDASASPMPVYFSEAEKTSLKKKMIEDVEFPYRRTFIVDVETIVVMGRLKGYKILRLHDVLD